MRTRVILPGQCAVTKCPVPCLPNPHRGGFYRMCGTHRAKNSAIARAKYQGLAAKPASAPEESLAFQLRAARVPEFTRQYKATALRQWKWDFAWPEARLVVDVHGGLFVRGAHSRGKRQEQDFEKQNAATIQGFRVLIVSAGQVTRGAALEWIEQALR